jgi:TetR/AcrR family transcriptional regulator, transcriptional repressor for nem operon
MRIIVSDTQQKLLDAAESRFRSDGYHGVSFRELADELEIKSSSVHYYYRRKQDLGLAVVERYATRLFEKLEDKCAFATTTRERLMAFCQVYRDAFVEQDKICLCGMLGAEKDGLPDELRKAVAGFLEGHIVWVADTMADDLGPERARARSEHIVATMQGALILAKNLSGIPLFDRIVADLLAD